MAQTIKRYRRYFVLGVRLVVAVLCLLLYCPTAAAQAQQMGGYRGICADTTCGTVSYWDSVIDASQFPAVQNGSAVNYTSTGTLCGQVNAVYAWMDNNVYANNPHSPYVGMVVVDARGVTNLTCGAGETPFDEVKTKGIGVTLLLPAKTIAIKTPWILPENVAIIGTSADSTGAAPTVIVASGMAAGQFMIQINTTTAPGCCEYTLSEGIAIESLVLDGQNTNVSGISNSSPGPDVRVRHVGLYRMLGTGLLLNGAEDSGPYEDITFDDTSSTTNPTTTCIQILGSAATKGIHGLRCLSADTTAAAGIRLDASNNTIDNVFVQGFTDGILIGAGGAARGNVISNVMDTTAATQYNSTVHISSTYPVSDLSLMGINNECPSSTGCKQVTIQDDIASSSISDTTVGTYFLGNNSSGSAYTRFGSSAFVSSGSNSVPTWLTGGFAPSGQCSSIGTLYSNTSASGAALWVCANASPHPLWTAIM